VCPIKTHINARQTAILSATFICQLLLVNIAPVCKSRLALCAHGDRIEIDLALFAQTVPYRCCASTDSGFREI